MAGDLQQKIDRIRSKTELLLERYRLLLQEKEAAESRIEELIHTVERQQAEIDRLKQDNEYLAVVTTIVPDRENVEKSRAFLSKLMQEIDKCILELTK